MVGPEFAGSLLKISRAEEHFKILESEVLAWKGRDPYIITKKCNSDGSRHGLIADFRERPPLDRWALITGDCIHNLRAALDSIVYAAAIRDSRINPPIDQSLLQFPIANTAAAYTNQKWRIRSLSARSTTCIERAQPYNRPHPELPPLLSLLSEFDNADKHRLLNVVVANAQQTYFSMVAPHDPDIFVPPQVGFSFGAIESGTEFAWFTVFPPQPDMKYDYEVTFVISIAHSAGPSGRTMGELGYILGLQIAEVRRIVDGFIF